MTNSELEKKSPDLGAFYRFGDFCLDSKRNVLTASGEPVALTYKAIQTLLVLIESQGRIVTKDEILDRVWKDTFVEENSLTRNISVLRKVLGESPNSKKFIETVPRRGYRFIHEVTKIVDTAVSEPGVKNAISTGKFVTAENKFPRYSENGTAKTSSQKTSSDAESEGKSISNSGENNFNAEPQIKSPFGKRTRIPALLFVFLILAITTFLSWESIKKYSGVGATIAEHARLSATKFTNTGNTLDAAISLDGKYVVYVADEGTWQSLWVRQTSDDGSNRAIQILPPSEVAFQGLAFAPDGNSIYYNVWHRQGAGEIYRIPILGGMPTKIIHDCFSSVNVSPADGKIAFIRVEVKENAQGLLISNADGEEEKLIARFNDDEWVAAASWSPNGKSLRVAVGKSDLPEKKQIIQLEEIFVETGERKLLSDKKWLGINQIASLPNGRGLIVSGTTDETEKVNQLWQVSLPSGDVQKLTSEASGYNGISTLTADGSMFVAVQRSVSYNLWTAPADHPTETTKITDGRSEGKGACWTRDGRIVFTSRLDTNPNIWIMQADGSGKKQLTGGNSISYNPVASPSDGMIYFVTNRSNSPQIWRIEENGQNLKQMTEDYGGGRYSVSPDGKSLIYVREVSGEPNALWKISTEGAAEEPKRLTELNSYAPSLSFDGKLVAYSFWDELHAEVPQWAYEIVSAEDGRKIKSLNFPLTVNIAAGAIQLGWLPDQSGIAYIDFQNKTSNVWIQPLDEKRRAFQLTDFKDGRVFQFNWSPDGKKILFVRGSELSDVVLIKIS